MLRNKAYQTSVPSISTVVQGSENIVRRVGTSLEIMGSHVGMVRLFLSRQWIAVPKGPVIIFRRIPYPRRDSHSSSAVYTVNEPRTTPTPWLLRQSRSLDLVRPERLPSVLLFRAASQYIYSSAPFTLSFSSFSSFYFIFRMSSNSTSRLTIVAPSWGWVGLCGPCEARKKSGWLTVPSCSQRLSSSAPFTWKFVFSLSMFRPPLMTDNISIQRQHINFKQHRLEATTRV